MLDAWKKQQWIYDQLDDKWHTPEEFYKKLQGYYEVRLVRRKGFLILAIKNQLLTIQLSAMTNKKGGDLMNSLGITVCDT